MAQARRFLGIGKAYAGVKLELAPGSTAQGTQLDNAGGLSGGIPSSDGRDEIDIKGTAARAVMQPLPAHRQRDRGQSMRVAGIQLVGAGRCHHLLA